MAQGRRHVEDKINAEAAKEIQGIYWSFLKFVNSIEVCTPMPRRNWNNTHRMQSPNTLIHLQSKARTRDDPCLVCRVSWRVVVRSAFERRTMSYYKHVFVQQQVGNANESSAKSSCQLGVMSCSQISHSTLDAMRPGIQNNIESINKYNWQSRRRPKNNFATTIPSGKCHFSGSC